MRRRRWNRSREGVRSRKGKRKVKEEEEIRKGRKILAVFQFSSLLLLFTAKKKSYFGEI